LCKDNKLTKDEYARLLNSAKQEKNQRLYYLIQTICTTGIRLSDLKAITVSAVECGQATINCKGKMIIVVLPKQLCKLLKGYISEQKIVDGFVFSCKNGKPLDRNDIIADIKKLCESAGVSSDKVFPYNFRHIFAYNSIQKSVTRLALILGHSAVNGNGIYTVIRSSV